MNRHGKSLPLLRVLAAVAWADGDVQPQEREFLLGLTRELGLSEEDVKEVLDLLDHPQPLDRFEAYVREYREGVGSPEEEGELLRKVEQMVAVDRVRSAEETECLASLKEWLGERGEGKLLPGRLRGILGGTRRGLEELGHRLSPGSVTAALSYRRVARSGKAPSTSLPPETRQYVTLHAALARRVLRADRPVSPDELERLRRIVSERFSLPVEEREQILQRVEDSAPEANDRQRLCSQFNRITEMDARLDLLSTLFAVGLSDGQLTREREGEIRLIANYLWIEVQEYVRIRRETHQQFRTGA